MSQFSKTELLSNINNAEKQTHILAENIEKDYYICQILKSIQNDSSIDYVVFRGGTSLSKCWKVINRFSEDIDFSIEYPIGESKRRNLKYKLKNICDSLGLEIINYDKLRSRTTMNRYEIKYPSLFQNEKSIILLEMSAFSISVFTIQKQIQSYIGEYLDLNTTINSSNYEQEPFFIKTQTLEKTFADKVFALCDYALTNRFSKGSRHIYDLYKIYPLVKNNPELKDIIAITRYDRMKRDKRPSSYENCDVNMLLQQISETNCFKNDYENTTLSLLGEQIDYKNAITTIDEISKSNLFTYNPNFNPISYLIEKKYIDSKNIKQLTLYTNYYNKPNFIEKTLIK